MFNKEVDGEFKESLKFSLIFNTPGAHTEGILISNHRMAEKFLVVRTGKITHYSQNFQLIKLGKRSLFYGLDVVVVQIPGNRIESPLRREKYFINSPTFASSPLSANSVAKLLLVDDDSPQIKIMMCHLQIPQVEARKRSPSVEAHSVVGEVQPPQVVDSLQVGQFGEAIVLEKEPFEQWQTGKRPRFYFLDVIAVQNSANDSDVMELY